MCASNGPSMESPNVSRFNSQSTGNLTLVGSDGRLSPPPHATSPILHTGQDNKQWIYLDSVSPKLLRELRKRYDPEHKDDVKIRGTGKIKAWARQGKRGIDLRLRRKVSTNRDEVTDITLTPDSVKPTVFAPSPVEPWFPELPSEREILELPDNSVPVPTLELSAEAERRDSRPLSVVSSSDTLPVYQRFEPPTHPVNDEAEPSGSLQGNLSVEQSTSVMDASADMIGTSLAAQALNTMDEETATEQSRLAALQESLAQTEQKMEEQQCVNESFKTMIGMLQRRPTEMHTLAPEDESSLDAQEVLENVKVSKPTVYETETDIEPSSPNASLRLPPVKENESRHRDFRQARVKGFPARPQKKCSRARIMSPIASNSDEAHSSSDLVQDRLVRRRTIPGKTPANADVEDLWKTLLLSGATLLGPEHPLLYQAKTDLAKSRATHHKGENPLATLWECRQIAENLLGAHPSVSKFVTDLETLTEMMGQDVLTANMQIAEKGPDLTPTAMSSSCAATLISPVPTREAAKGADKPPTSHSNRVFDTSSPVTAESARSPVRPELAVNTDIPSIAIHNAEPFPEKGAPRHLMYNTTQPPHKPRSNLANFFSLAISAVANNASQGLAWVQDNYGSEPRVEVGKVRVRWTCSCGDALHDDFIETRPGAARELEAYLNRPRTHTGPTDSPTSPNSSTASKSFSGSSLGGPPSSQTSWSSSGLWNGQSPSSAHTKQPRVDTGSLPIFTPYNPPEPPWLLTCANEDRYTPKLSHLDMSRQKVRSDKDLALSLREHYYSVNKKWYRMFRLRGLSSIEFVQFEVHQNRFCDLRKVPDMPPPSRLDEYDFTPGDLLPPVGSTYLLHLFGHPQDYDGELVTYLRSPKKSTGRLSLGVGWGINLVEGFEASKVWTLIAVLFTLASTIFGTVWACSKQDIQGAFGVAAWILALAIMIIGWAQASFG